VTEHEVKLRFDSPEAARRAVTSAGACLVVSRRLLVDTLHDTEDRQLGRAGCALRLRRDAASGILTFKGPVQPSGVKSREEIETTIGDIATLELIVERLGFRPWFRAEKFREEYDLGGAHIAIDEAPIGTFVEIEAPPDAIDRCARLLDRGPADYCLRSYASLYYAWCADHGKTPGDMTFNA
jgi:adenylate cyclase class 2